MEYGVMPSGVSQRWLRLVAAAVLVAACSGPSGSRKSDGLPGGGEQAGEAEPAEAEDGGASRGLIFELESAEHRPDPDDRVRSVTGEPLEEARRKELLSRLPKLEEASKGAEPFSFASPSKPPPRTGSTEMTPFPPAGESTPPAGESKGGDGLKVTRKVPVGSVENAPRLGVTFSKPMLAVGARPSYEESRPPVRIRPAVEGTWRWVGVRTLIFEPAGGRFPMATEYRVTVSAEVEADDGTRLGSDVSWTFRTPPVRIETVHPKGGPHRREPLMFMAFNQKIDRGAILEYLQCWGGGDTFSPRLAARQRVEAHERISRLAEGAPEDQWIAFYVPKRLRARTTYQIGLAQGAPSAEGPRRTREGSYETFRTHGPLTVESAGCGSNRCVPGEPMTLRFNHRLDPGSIDPSALEIEPELEDREIDVRGDALVVYGETSGRTSYTLRVPASVRDRFGERLGGPVARTIEVGPASPAVVAAGRRVTLDPEGPRQYGVRSVGFERLAIRAHRVDPSDWPDYVRARERDDVEVPGKQILDETIPVDGSPDDWTRTQIDLKEVFGGRYGNAVLVVRGVDPTAPVETEGRSEPRSARVWVQSTELAVDAFVDDRQLVAWTTSLSKGRPVDGVEIALAGSRVSGETGTDGTVRLDLPAKLEEPWREVGSMVIASKGDDTAFVPEWSSRLPRASQWTRTEGAPEARWFTFDDRHLYRPGETLHLKGWLRLVESEGLALPEEGRSLSYTVAGPRGNELGTGTAAIDAHGGFDLTFRIPEGANLGRSEVRFRLEGEDEAVQTRHRFEIREFRRPSFEVGIDAPAGPHLVGGAVEIPARASYYGGGAVRGADVAWSVEARRADFSPPGWSEFAFGAWRPWWDPYGAGRSTTGSLQGRTDERGRHRLAIKLRESRPPFARHLEVSATVTDVDRQTVAGRRQMLVHPASAYVGLRTDRRFVAEGEPIAVDVVATAIDGTALEGRSTTVTAERLDWEYRDGRWAETVAASSTCEVQSKADPVECTFTPEKGGVWRVTGEVRDEKGRRSVTRMRVWVGGGRQPTSRRVEREQVRLVPRAPTWKPGETAEVLVQAPFAEAEGLATLQRDGIVETIRFSIDGTSHRLEIPIEESYAPGVALRVDLAGSAPRLDATGTPRPKEPNRPAFATGRIDLGVSKASRSLEVSVEPGRRDVEPGGEATVDLEVRTAEGDPVSGSQVAVAVVDEARLAAADYGLPAPLAAFYPREHPGVHARLFRESVVLASLQDVRAAPRARGKHEMKSEDRAPTAAAGRRGAQLRLREDFDPLAHFAPALETDAKGRVSVSFETPDRVTRYRVIAVAADGADRFGSGADRLTTQLPVRVEPSLPRFLHRGDRAELPVVVHNRTDQARAVELAARSANLSLEGSGGVRFDVPANDRVEYRFPSEAEHPGTARIQFALVSEDRTDAAQLAVPVRTPSGPETHAAYGSVDSEGVTGRSIEVPRDALAGYGGLSVTTSSTALHELTDALLDLEEMSFAGAEQRASRMLGIVALRDVLKEFDAPELPAPEELDETVRRDLEALVGLQTTSGGFPRWSSSSRADPFTSVHVAHALVAASKSGYGGLEAPLRRALGYLREIDGAIPSDWTTRVEDTVRAYALYVLQKAGAPQPGRVTRLAEKPVGEKLSVEAAAWLISTLAEMPSGTKLTAKLRRQIENRLVVESGSAHVASKDGGQGHAVLHSRRRADALVLEAMLRSEASTTRVSKLAEGLLGHRRRGRWRSTQENVFAILALKTYFETLESEPPDFAVDLWIGDGYLGRHTYRERRAKRSRVDVPIEVLRDRSDGSALPLRIRRSGREGRLYYRIAMTYAPASRPVDPVERGFAIERTFRAVRGPGSGDSGTVRQQKNGTWRLEAGTRVRVELRFVAPSPRHHVALVDPLAAGFEALNPSIATAEPVPADGRENPEPAWWRPAPWFEHQSLGAERVEAFASSLEAGVYTYSYVVRATTPGEFVVPAPRIAEMYHPETFGRGASDRLVVEGDAGE